MVRSDPMRWLPCIQGVATEMRDSGLHRNRVRKSEQAVLTCQASDQVVSKLARCLLTTNAQLIEPPRTQNSRALMERR